MRAGYLWDKGQEYLAKRSSRYIGELVLPRPKYPCTRVRYPQSTPPGFAAYRRRGLAELVLAAGILVLYL